jgi:excisionase family DNA binding protein
MIDIQRNDPKGSADPARISTTTPRHPMTPQQAAAFLGLDDKTVGRWARKGYLPAHPMGEGKRRFWRFFEDELLAWLLNQSDVAVAA